MHTRVLSMGRRRGRRATDREENGWHGAAWRGVGLGRVRMGGTGGGADGRRWRGWRAAAQEEDERHGAARCGMRLGRAARSEGGSSRGRMGVAGDAAREEDGQHVAREENDRKEND